MKASPVFEVTRVKIARGVEIAFVRLCETLCNPIVKSIPGSHAPDDSVSRDGSASTYPRPQADTGTCLWVRPSGDTYSPSGDTYSVHWENLWASIPVLPAIRTIPGDTYSVKCPHWGIPWASIPVLPATRTIPGDTLRTKCPPESSPPANRARFTSMTGPVPDRPAYRRHPGRHRQRGARPSCRRPRADAAAPAFRILPADLGAACRTG